MDSISVFVVCNMSAYLHTYKYIHMHIYICIYIYDIDLVSILHAIQSVYYTLGSVYSVTLLRGPALGFQSVARQIPSLAKATGPRDHLHQPPREGPYEMMGSGWSRQGVHVLQQSLA